MELVSRVAPKRGGMDVDRVELAAGSAKEEQAVPSGPLQGKAAVPFPCPRRISVSAPSKALFSSPRTGHRSEKQLR